MVVKNSGLGLEKGSWPWPDRSWSWKNRWSWSCKLVSCYITVLVISKKT